ncbi:MAG: sigma-70 family RNA polymerase sigma factor [Myxococcota bacterium]
MTGPSEGADDGGTEAGGSQRDATTATTTTIAGLYDLMDRYIDGDPRAFAKLHAMLGPRLRGFLMRLVRDEAAVDDLVQLTLLKAHLARERFALQGGDPDGAVQGWYFAICRNVAMDHLRNRYRGKNRIASQSSEGADPMVDLVDAGPNVEELGQAIEREDAIIDRVRAAIAKLPAGQREVVELHKLRGMTMAEISERLAVREGAVRVRAHRAYKALARMLSRTPMDVIALFWLFGATAEASPRVARPDAWPARACAPPRHTAAAPRPDASRTEHDSCRRASAARTPRGSALVAPRRRSSQRR